MRAFLFFVMCAIFFTGAEYAIIRPASQAIFLTAYSAEAIPWVWLATVPLNLSIVSLYSWLVIRLGPFRVMALFVACIMGIHLLTALFVKQFPLLIAFEYAWKDVYILLMFKQIWSMIHTRLEGNRGGKLYGVIFSMGMIGSMAASQIPIWYAADIGLENLFFFTIPLYALIFLAYALAFRTVATPLVIAKEPKVLESFSLFRGNTSLLRILGMVVAMQMFIAFVEYQFNIHLEKEVATRDLRAAFAGKVHSYINLFTLLMQFLGSAWVMRYLSLYRAQMAVPFALLALSSCLLGHPTLGLAALALIGAKTVDFSLFSVVRETLYGTLSLDEKFRGKAVIDVFAHRSAKAITSLFLIAFGSLSLSIWMGALVAAIWLFALVYFAKRDPIRG